MDNEHVQTEREFNIFGPVNPKIHYRPARILTKEIKFDINQMLTVKHLEEAVSLSGIEV